MRRRNRDRDRSPKRNGTWGLLRIERRERLRKVRRAGWMGVKETEIEEGWREEKISDRKRYPKKCGPDVSILAGPLSKAE